jgi:hypothetical protein
VTTPGARTGGLAKLLTRDTFTFLGGWYLIIYQAQFAATFNLSVFIGGMVAAGIPGVLAVFSARAGVAEAGPAPIDPPSAGPSPSV